MINIAIVGYGNLGRGVECAVEQNDDISLCGIFTRRDPESVKALSHVHVLSISDIMRHKDSIDVLILCGGSSKDLPEQSPFLAEHFCIVDSFDTHLKIPSHFEKVDAAAKSGGRVAIISAGWDPGLFSLCRLYGEAVLPCGKSYTFWGKGVSQGHSDAIRRIKGVSDAKQYTIPVKSAVDSVRNGGMPTLSAREAHMRECFVAVNEGADISRIENEIKTMPGYFADYDTSVHFVSQETLKLEHSALSHGGFVMRTGKTGVECGNSHVIEYSLKLDSNPEFTASVLVAYARAAVRMKNNGSFGCKTVFDIPPSFLSPMSPEELRQKLL